MGTVTFSKPLVVEINHAPKDMGRYFIIHIPSLDKDFYVLSESDTKVQLASSFIHLYNNMVKGQHSTLPLALKLKEIISNINLSE